MAEHVAPPADDQPFDNSPREWQQSIVDWLQDGVRMADRIDLEARSHGAASLELRRLVKQLRRGLRAASRPARPARPSEGWTPERRAQASARMRELQRQRRERAQASA